MNNYTIVCDSACDLSPEMLKERNLSSVSLTYRFDGDQKEYCAYDLNAHEFYNKIKSGTVAKTSGANAHDFIALFEPILLEGHDILYLGFSSALSTTFNSSKIAAEELRKKYHDKNIVLVDTLCASAGIAMMLDLALEMQSSGESIDRVAEFIEKTKLHICHWFTVDNLEYLKRGGRISSTSAFFGNMIGIKPVLHVDNAGRLVNRLKVRGRRTAIAAMAEKFSELSDNCRYVYISHADCPSDAMHLSNLLKERYGVETRLITDIGAVIGAHAGPGTLALFFLGKER